MFINPHTAVENGWITFPQWVDTDEYNKYLQPNAIDFTVDSISTVKDDVFAIGETNKISRSLSPLARSEDNGSLFGNAWLLEPIRCYDIASDFYVNVPEGVAALLVTRSTFIRNGLFIQSGIFDSGFSGHIGCVAFNMCGETYIAQHTRIAQIAFVRSDSNGKYAGGYNTAVGQHWTELAQPTH